MCTCTHDKKCGYHEREQERLADFWKLVAKLMQKEDDTPTTTRPRG